jgi:hypothetical protein
MKIGSPAHKELFCRSFIATHNPYEIEALPWPELDAAALERLRSVPFWEEVFYAERRAGMLVEAFARTIDDPLLREAVDLQGFEEARHASTPSSASAPITSPAAPASSRARCSPCSTC